MKRSFRRRANRHQDGSVAVEAAVCIAFILAPLISFLLLFGRFFWYYTVAQKAVHDATLYLAGAPLSEIKSQTALNLASNIVTREIVDLAPDATVEPSFNCGYKISPSFPDLAFGNCSGSTTPEAVQTFALMYVPMPFFFDNDGIRLVPITAMRYVGK